MQTSQIRWLQMGVGFALGATLALLFVILSNRTRPAPIEILPPATATPIPATSTPSPYLVYVNGEVQRPDVYEVPHGSRVQDVIVMAGGFTESALVEVVNLAAPLFDGQQLFVPNRVQSTPVPDVVLMQTVESVSAESVASSAEATSPETPSDASGRVNINTANRAELETLPGVGESTAQKIVSYREDNGPFAAIEEIMNVSGIGEGKFEQMKDLIYVGE